jgi:Glycosyl transferase family 90
MAARESGSTHTTVLVNASTGLKNRNCQSQPEASIDFGRVSRGLRRGTMLPRRKTAVCVRLVVVSVLGIGSLSLAMSLWWLPSIAQDGGVQRNALALGSIPQHPAAPQQAIPTAKWGTTLDPPNRRPRQQPGTIRHHQESLSIAKKDSKSSPMADDGLEGGYRSQEEMFARSTRFPSVDERVKVYMTNWYLPPCEAQGEAVVEYNYIQQNLNNSNRMIFREERTAKEKKRSKLRTFMVDDTTGFDLLRYLNRENIRKCLSSYCIDTVRYLFPAMDRATNHSTIDAPVLFQFSDAEKTRAYVPDMERHGPYPNIPHLKKFRFALSKAERDRVVRSDKDCAPSPREVPVTIVQEQQLQGTSKSTPTVQPIIFKLKMQRHYGYVQAIPAKDRPWSQKKDQAIFRGQFTGRFPAGMLKRDIEKLPIVAQCQLLHRCWLVYNSVANTTANKRPLVDAKLALPVLEVRRDFPKTINGVDLYGERASIEHMLTYKVIIMLEGNDVSSGLKWALYSNSVVMTQTPTKTSWAMEELLEPWVHYIPLADDLSDVEEKMQWVIYNDDEAQKIANRGKLWISDLVFHPDVKRDEQHIFDEILRRYQTHFVRNPSLQLPASEVQ